MEFLTAALRCRLLENGITRLQIETDPDQDAEFDFVPVVKLFTPDADAVWLLTEIDPDDCDRAFGLCDLGLGYPELGYVSLRITCGSPNSLNVRSNTVKANRSWVVNKASHVSR